MTSVKTKAGYRLEVLPNGNIWTTSPDGDTSSEFSGPPASAVRSLIEDVGASQLANDTALERRLAIVEAKLDLVDAAQVGGIRDLVKRVSAIEAGERPVVFAWHHEVYSVLVSALDRAGVTRDGSLSDRVGRVIDRFRDAQSATAMQLDEVRSQLAKARSELAQSRQQTLAALSPGVPISLDDVNKIYPGSTRVVDDAEVGPPSQAMSPDQIIERYYGPELLNGLAALLQRLAAKAT